MQDPSQHPWSLPPGPHREERALPPVQSLLQSFPGVRPCLRAHSFSDSSHSSPQRPWGKAVLGDRDPEMSNFILDPFAQEMSSDSGERGQTGIDH